MKRKDVKNNKNNIENNCYCEEKQEFVITILSILLSVSFVVNLFFSYI